MNFSLCKGLRYKKKSCKVENRRLQHYCHYYCRLSDTGCNLLLDIFPDTNERIKTALDQVRRTAHVECIVLMSKVKK